MKTQRIQQPERYEAPGVKIKMLRRKASLLALSLGGGTESNEGSDGTDKTEDYDFENGTW